MNKRLALTLAMLAMTWRCAAARADITVGQVDSTNGVAGLAGQSLGNAADASINGTGSNIASFNVSDGPGSSPDFADLSASQSLESSKDGKLSDIKLMVTGNPSGVTLSLSLYDVGPASHPPTTAPSDSAKPAHPLADTGANGYLNPAQANDGKSPGAVNTTFVGDNKDPAGKTAGGGNYIDGSKNLLSPASKNIQLPGYTSSGANDAILDFQTSAADAITLKANEEYVVEVSNIHGRGIFLQRQSATSTNYPFGQAFKGQVPVIGNSNRDFGMGLSVTSPTTAP